MSAETVHGNTEPSDLGTVATGKPAVFAGRFELQEMLGSGGMATVHRAWDRAARRTCAVKVLGDLLSRNEEFRHRFRREAEAVIGLAHPHIVAVYAWGEVPPHDYIAMEYVAGGTLHDLLRRRGRLSEAEALRFAAEIAEALAYAHGRDVVHRDIKPHNILLTDDGHAKVADFGIARTLDATNLTRSGTVMGSARYISPEQAWGDQAGPASDQYSLGIVLYEMLAGQVPFTGEAPVAIALKHLHDPLPDLRAARPDVSPDTVALVERLLAKDPGRRYPHAEHVAVDLRRIAAKTPADRAGDETANLSRVRPVGDHTDAMPQARQGRRLPRLGSAHRPTGVSDTSQMPAAPSPRPSRSTWARVALFGMIVLFIAALAVTAYRTAWLATHVAVPSLVGRPMASAGQVVLPLELGVMVTQQRQDPHAPVGVILSQDPPPGRQVMKGSVIQLTVSQGSGTVPDVHGLPVSQAIRQLETTGLRLGRVSYTPDDQAASGTVITQFQPPGTHLAPNGPVDVLVSQGPPPAPLSTPWFFPHPNPESDDNRRK